MVVDDGLGDVLHHHRLAGLGRRDDQRALAFALRRHQIHDAAGDVFRRTVAAFEGELAAREQRRQVLEQHLALGGFQRLAVERVEHVQRDVALAVLRAADATGDFVAGAQVEAADLAGRDVHIVRAGEVAGVGAAQEAVTVRQDLQHAVGGDAVGMAREHLQQGEGDVLLAHARHAFVQVQLLGHFQQLVRRHALEVVQAVGREIRRQLRRLVGLAFETLAVAVVVLAAAAFARAALLAIAVATLAKAFAAHLAAALVALFARLRRTRFAGRFVVAAALRFARFGDGDRCRRRLRRGTRDRGFGDGFGRGLDARLAAALHGGCAGFGLVFGHGLNPRGCESGKKGDLQKSGAGRLAGSNANTARGRCTSWA